MDRSTNMDRNIAAVYIEVSMLTFYSKIQNVKFCWSYKHKKKYSWIDGRDR